MVLSSAKPSCSAVPLAQNIPSKQAMQDLDRKLQGICKNPDSILRGAIRSELHHVNNRVNFKSHPSTIEHVILCLYAPE